MEVAQMEEQADIDKRVVWFDQFLIKVPFIPSDEMELPAPYTSKLPVRGA